MPDETPPTPVEVVKAAVDPARLAGMQDKLRGEQTKRDKRYGTQR